MRKLSRILLAFVVAASALALVTCAAKPSSIVLMHDKGGNPDYRPFYDQMGQLSKAATGVGIHTDPGIPTPLPTRPRCAPRSPPTRPLTCSPGGPPTG